LILTDKIKLLLCHPTGRDFWNIPKGLAEVGETPLQTCIRETWEETGLKFLPEDFFSLGEFKYLPHKDLVLFLVIRDLPDIAAMKCTSMFRNPSGLLLPEHDAFKYATWEQAIQCVNKALKSPIKEIQKVIIREKSLNQAK
jgi:putative (di)nucleoside polyphosphate hydrolase